MLGFRLILTALIATSPALAENEDFQRSKEKLEQTLERFTSQSWMDGDSLKDMASRIFGRGATSEIPIGPNSADTLVTEKEADEKDGPPKGAASGPPAIGGTAQTLPKWLPYCFLVDPAQNGQQVNQAIKTMADEYAKCGVALDVHAFTIQPGYPQDPDQLNELARQACDFGRAFEVRGAVQVWSGNGQIAKDMCEDDQAVGCSTLCERISVAQVAPGQSSYVALHESLHSNCCGRACVDAGAGTEPAGYGTFLVQGGLRDHVHTRDIRWAETEQDVPRQGDEQTPPQQISQEACGAISAGAPDNTGLHRYDPAKQTYYVAATDPAAMKALDGNSFFTAKPKFPEVPLSGKGVGGEGGVGLTGNGDGAQISFTEVPKGRPPGGGNVRHQGRDEASIALLGAVGPDVGEGQKLRNAPPAAQGTGSGTPRISFDDSAKKRATGGSEGNSGAATSFNSATSDPGSYLDPSDALTMGDSGAVAPPPSVVGGTPSPRIGFNDNAQKGGPVGNGLALPGAEGTSGYQGPPAGGPAPGETESFSFESILQGASSLASSFGGGDFWGAVGDDEETEEQKRRRGAALRARDGRGIKRDSESGLKKRSDVLISTRPDPDFVTNEQTPYPGIY